MGPLVLPVLVQRVVPDSQKGGALGALGAIGLIIAIIVQPLSGAWSDTHATRWGKRRPYLVGGTLTDVIFLIALVFADNYLALVIAYMLLQIVSNIAHGPYQAYIPELVPEAKRGAVTGVKQSFEMTGFIITSLVIGGLVGQQQLGLAFAAIIAVLLVSMFITARFVNEIPFAGATTHPIPEPANDSIITTIFHNRDFTLWLLGRLFILTGSVAVRNYAVYFAQDVLHLENPTTEIGVLLAIIGTVVAAVAYPAGIISDRWGRKPLVLISGVLGIIGAGLFASATDMTQMMLYGSIIGVSTGIFLSANWAWGADLIPQNSSGRLLGVSNLATAGSGVLAGAGGFLLDTFKTQSTDYGYTILYLSAAACYLIGTLISAFIHDKINAR